MSERELSDAEREQAAETLDGLDDTDLLIGILTELQQIRLLLSDESAQQDAGDAAGMYACQRCGATVEAGERERHARSEHRAPPGVAEELFEEV